MGMNTSLRKSLRNRLIRRDGELCHYCECVMVEPVASAEVMPDTMTLEHIVPQSCGGSNEMTNLVLACSDCNNTRGNDINFCWCNRCKNVITDWYNKSFNSLIKANTPRVHKRKNVDGWRVRVHKRATDFKTWPEAMHFALTGEKL